MNRCARVICLCGCVGTFLYADVSEFARSFIEGLCFSNRFVNEYHPYVLKLTNDSLAQFEERVVHEGFEVDGRLVIMGYEQNAVAPYFNCLSQPIIDDEALGKVGNSWDAPPTNMFGFLCGYLFKDAPSTGCSYVQHIDADTVELFDPNTHVLQKHALGQWYDLVIGYQAGVQRELMRANVPCALAYVVDFLQELYESAGQWAHGAQLATQDALFSFYYLRHLVRSRAIIKKLFVGPDITYPIQVLNDQVAAVTSHAQHFVKTFVPYLTNASDKKTAYIFCSLVDGVGKSTLLGNVQNFLAHGENFAQYAHTNSVSSQRAQVFDVNDKVCIVDMPAQMSHYTFRPDGYVYIDVGFDMRVDRVLSEKIYNYVNEHADQLVHDVQDRMRLEVASSVRPDPAIDPEGTLLHNVADLNVPLVWIPFMYEGLHYVVHRYDLQRVRILTHFDDVHSQGLKIKEPELMLFTGLALPMSYAAFVDDVITQLRAHNVERVVYVDFLSMYPRTSRETVRINFMVQQLRTLYPDDFSLDASIYQPSANRFGTYPLFTQRRDQFEQALLLETLLRYGLLQLVCNNSNAVLTKLDNVCVRKALEKTVTTCMIDGSSKKVARIIGKRVDQELPRVEHYQYAREYETGTRFDVQHLAQVWRMVHALVLRWIRDDNIRSFWQQCDGVITLLPGDNNHAVLANGTCVRFLGKLDPYQLDQASVDRLVGILRQQWCAQLVDLLTCADTRNYHAVYGILPDTDGVLWVVCANDEVSAHEEQALLRPSSQLAQVFGAQSQLSLMRMVASSLRSGEFRIRYGSDAQYLFVPTALIVSEIEKFSWWEQASRSIAGRGRGVQVPADELTGQVTRALATVFSCLKCSTDEIMVRRDNVDDFAAMLILLERCIYPAICGLRLQNRLFDDYTAVEPLVGNFQQHTAIS